MKRSIGILGVTFILAAGSAAALTPDEAIRALQADGFSRVELRVGPTQMKAEAIRGSEKVEIIYDLATGQILKKEIEPLRADDDTRPGVSIRNGTRDFVRLAQAGGGWNGNGADTDDNGADTDDNGADTDDNGSDTADNGGDTDDNGGRSSGGNDDRGGNDNGGGSNGRDD